MGLQGRNVFCEYLHCALNGNLDLFYQLGAGNEDTEFHSLCFRQHCMKRHWIHLLPIGHRVHSSWPVKDMLDQALLIWRFADHKFQWRPRFGNRGQEKQGNELLRNIYCEKNNVLFFQEPWLAKTANANVLVNCWQRVVLFKRVYFLFL